MSHIISSHRRASSFIQRFVLRSARRRARRGIALALSVAVLLSSLLPLQSLSAVAAARRDDSRSAHSASGGVSRWTAALSALLPTLFGAPQEEMPALAGTTAATASNPLLPLVSPVSARPTALIPREERESRVAHLSLNLRQHVVLRERQKMMLAAVPLDARGNTVHGVMAQWRSSAPQIVHVTRHGLMRAQVRRNSWQRWAEPSPSCR